MRDPAEERLLADLAEGREAAFAELYDRFGRSMYRVAWTMLRSNTDAEDAVQNVFLAILRSRKLLTRVENLRAYLFSIVRNSVLRIASRTRAEQTARQDIATARNSGTKNDDAEWNDWFSKALAALPPDQREVLSLKIDGDLTFAEVADVLRISPNTAASRYRYALEKLRALMKAEQDETRTTAAESR